jgi:nicotinate-nucleotide adenylyltransferase
MRLGVLGGTFNPVHYGHLRLAEEALARFGLQSVLLVLSAIPPHKDSRIIADPQTRWNLLNLACSDNPALVPCDLEMARPGPSYTVDTLSLIRDGLSSGDEVFLILGMDAAAEIQTWKSWQVILESVHVVVARRPGCESPALEPEVARRVQVFEIPQIDISASRIRRLVEEDRSIRYLVPDSVREAIFAQGVYSRERSHRPILEPSMKPHEAAV